MIAWTHFNLIVYILRTFTVEDYCYVLLIYESCFSRIPELILKLSENDRYYEQFQETELKKAETADK